MSALNHPPAVDSSSDALSLSPRRHGPFTQRDAPVRLAPSPSRARCRRGRRSLADAVWLPALSPRSSHHFSHALKSARSRVRTPASRPRALLGAFAEWISLSLLRSLSRRGPKYSRVEQAPRVAPRDRPTDDPREDYLGLRAKLVQRDCGSFSCSGICTHGIKCTRRQNAWLFSRTSGLLFVHTELVRDRELEESRRM